VPATAAAAVSVPPPDALLPVLMQRGNAALATGDITAARLLFDRAAHAGSARAARALGKTYDIRFLLETGANASAANADLAAQWYRRAAELEDQGGRALPVRADNGGRQ
jgi:TPR repeat protein